jgi:hypothetical protein
MFRHYRRRQKGTTSAILSLIVVLTIPLAIYSIVNSNLDIRKFAFEDRFSSNCSILLPYTNEKTLAKNKNYQIIVQGEFEGENVKNLKIHNKLEEEIFSKDFPTLTEEILENFIYTPTATGEEKIKGFVETDRTIHPCVMDTDFILVREQNYAPIFLTNPYVSAEPNTNSLAIGDEYKYTIEATDRDGDRIQYHYTSIPNANWLHAEVIQNGDFGALEITFSGRPDEQGMYLINFYIHDGYHKHLSSQSWIINVTERRGDSPQTERPREPQIPQIIEDFENIVKLNSAHLTNFIPSTNSIIKASNPTISVILNASYGGEILGESIKFKLNTKNILNESDIVEISPSQFKLTYPIIDSIHEGEHQILVAFKDSNGAEVNRTSNFETESENEENKLFGISINTIAIVLMGLFLIILALSIPWILYIAWKKNEDKEYEEASVPKKD